MKDIPKLNKSVEGKHDSWGILDIKRKFDEGNLIVQQDFQRRDVWDNVKKSRLIESMLRGIPIPSIYVEEVEEGKYVVIDGQQRINSIIEYLNEDFGLRGLSLLEGLMNKKYNNIKGIQELNVRFQDAKIHVIIITSENEEIKYEIFDRLNTGAVKLTAQELRNCKYHGEYNDLIKELAEDEDFKPLLGNYYDIFHKRMKNEELVLRFFAFNNTHPDDYKPPIKRFLDREMESPDRGIRELSDKEIEESKNIFKKSVRLTKEVFGKNAFRKFDVGSNKEVNGKWGKQINTALFDIEICGFAKYDKNIIQCKDSIYEELIYMMTQDSDFIRSIGDKNYEKDKVRTRFQKWFDALKKITENRNNNFSLETRKKVYRDSPDCCICNERIQDIDDAEVDGVKYYWRGETIPINARLIHRYCNSKEK